MSLIFRSAKGSYDNPDFALTGPEFDQNYQALLDGIAAALEAASAQQIVAALSALIGPARLPSSAIQPPVGYQLVYLSEADQIGDNAEFFLRKVPGAPNCFQAAQGTETAVTATSFEAILANGTRPLYTTDQLAALIGQSQAKWQIVTPASGTINPDAAAGLNILIDATANVTLNSIQHPDTTSLAAGLLTFQQHDSNNRTLSVGGSIASVGGTTVNTGAGARTRFLWWSEPAASPGAATTVLQRLG